MEVARKKRSAKRMYGMIVIAYLLICALLLTMEVVDAGRTIEEYNSSQAKLVSGLLVKNVNVALDNTVAQIEEVGYAVTSGREDDPEFIYYALQLYAARSDITSIGFVDRDSSVYGREGDQEDLAKLGYLKRATEEKDTTVTDPYRSKISGSIVMTIFVPIYKGGRRFGTVYANLPLELLQQYANMGNLSRDTSIYLINCHSLNSISCMDGEYMAAGAWNNLALRQMQMEFDSKHDYQGYISKMQNGVKGDSVSYTIDGVSYTQGYERIEKMPGWYLAVEIPDNAMSDSFHAFRDELMVCSMLLVLLTVGVGILIVIIEIVRRKNFEKLSSTDTMTGLYNKRTFTALVEDYLAESKDSGVLIFVDVDDFKNYNDTYGHLNGDNVLKKFATELQEEFGSIGIVGRYGGDEFILFIKNAPDKGVVDVAMERLRKRLSVIELKDFGEVPLSFSSGGARFPQDATSFTELCERADDALYRVKNEGKGKYYWYQ